MIRNPSRLYRKANLPALAAVTLLVCGPGAVAQDAASNPALPPLKPAVPLHLPAIVQQTLPNGMKIVVLEDHRQPAVWLRLAIGAGSDRDPANRVGLAQMEAGMLDKGTSSRTETQIADKIDGIGATLSAGADPDFLTVSASGLTNYTDTLFDLTADVTLHPAFPQDEIERLRTQTLSSIVNALGQPATVADAALNRRIFGAHPYGNFASGTPDSVKAITQQDLKQFHDRLFAPNNATLFVVGDIAAAQAMAKAQTAFGGWQRHEVPAGPPAPSAIPSAGGAQITIVDRPGAAQTEVRIGIMVGAYSDPMRPVGRVGSAVLGVGQFESRLTKEIRVKRGLTYGAASTFDRMALSGKFEITTFTKNASTGEVVKIALDELRKIQTEPTPPDELQERKDLLNGAFAVSVATSPGVLNRLVYAVLYGAGPDDLTRITTDTQAVTSAQIEDYMKSLPLDRPQIVLVGDASQIESQVKPYGAVTVIPAGSLDLQSPSLMAKAAPETGGQQITGGSEEGKSRLMAAITALGGGAFLNLKSITLKGEGEISPPGQEITVPISAATLVFATGGRSRFELNTAFGDVIIGNDGKNAPWLSAIGSIQDGPAGLGDPTELLRRAASSNYPVSTLADIMSESGAILTGFGVTDEQKHTTKVYMDSKTHLPQRLVMQSGGYEVRIGDYHAAEQVKVPGSIKVTQNGKALLTLKFKGWQFNTPVDDKAFARPKA